MIMPTKIIQPVDSLLAISSSVLKIIHINNNMSIDELFDEINKSYYKKISIDKLLLCLNFLYLIDMVENDNEIIKTKF